MKNFMIGCNFWDSKSGTDMWLNFDEDSLAADLDALAENGVRYIRCFPNWRDFQPVTALREWRGNFKEYRLTGDRFPENEYYIEPVMIERFRRFATMADERGIKLIVSILTGWMSGRLFCPPALDSKNLICDPEALMFEEKFVRGFVLYTRDLPNIAVWDLGNECNCLGQASTPAQSYLWTVTIRNAILASDSTRRISSGMHSLGFEENQPWSIHDQGLLTDMLTPHPYPSPTVGGDVDPADRPRTTMIPTAQCEYYAGLSGRDVMIQEQGTFSDMLINREGAAAFLRANVCSSYANGYKGYLWWCSHEHLHLKNPPYSWSMIERELGMLDLDRKPKPVGVEMKRLAGLLDKLPDLPKRQNDSVIVLSRGQDQWQTAVPSFILAKRAGLTPVISSCYHDIPEAPLYFLPSVTGWASLYKEAYDTLLERAANGATLMITVNSGLLCEFERVTGLRSDGMLQGGHDKFTFGGSEFGFDYGKKFLLKSIGAEVLATDSTGNVVFSRNRFGKGEIVILAFPLENMLWRRQGAYEDNMPDYSLLYAEAAKKVLAEKPMRCLDPDVSLTLNPDGDGYYAVAVNYVNEKRDPRVTLADGWKLETIYGDFNSVEPCDMAVGRLVRK